ncbi:MAG TPA: 50S ribosomal protein L9 [Candidatus Onthovivens sp.]|nr:50S ribosomal protein L9 [Candidatus Onthovivens sp.]
MEIILLSDVKGIGKKGETKTVSDGYATNFLIPKKLAVRKTEGSVQVLNKQIEVENEKQAELKAEALKVKEYLETLTLEFKAKVQPSGNMAGTISSKEIVEKLKTEYKIIVDKRKILDKFKVNAFGFTNFRIELYKGVIGTIRIHVAEEK